MLEWHGLDGRVIVLLVGSFVAYALADTASVAAQTVPARWTTLLTVRKGERMNSPTSSCCAMTATTGRHGANMLEVSVADQRGESMTQGATPHTLSLIHI